MEGTDDCLNIVPLTGREHIVAHLLLTKIYPSHSGLAYAADMMCNVKGVSRKWVKERSNEKRKLRKSGIYKTCQVCNKEFYTFKCNSWRKACSKECGSKITKALQQYVVCVCAGCNKEYSRKTYHVRDQKKMYCSRECKFKSGWVELECNVCGTIYSKRKHVAGKSKYCSRKCLNDSKRKIVH